MGKNWAVFAGASYVRGRRPAVQMAGGASKLQGGRRDSTQLSASSLSLMDTWARRGPLEGANPWGWVPVMGHATHSSWCQIGSLSAGWLGHESALFMGPTEREEGGRDTRVLDQHWYPVVGRWTTRGQAGDPTRATHPGSDNPRNFSPWAGATASLLPGSAHVSPCQGSSWAGSRGNPGDTGVATADVGGGYTQRSCRQPGRG